MSDRGLKFYLQKISKFEVLSREKELEVFCSWQGGNRAAGDTLINSHLHFAFYRARDYATRFNQPVDDLIQVANEGLLRARETFDPTRGYRFATYARYWVHQKLGKFCRKNKSIVRRPDGSALPSADLSLNTECFDGSHQEWIDTLRSEDPNSDEQMISEELRRAVFDIARMSAHTPRERYIIEKRLLSSEPHSQCKIAARMKVERIVVRHAEKKVLARIESGLKAARK